MVADETVDPVTLVVTAELVAVVGKHADGRLVPLKAAQSTERALAEDDVSSCGAGAGSAMARTVGHRTSAVLRNRSGGIMTEELRLLGRRGGKV